MKNPNSSYIWIQYIAFKFQKDGIEKARQLMERALRTIMFRNENEKLNLWTAYINLEYNFGTEDSLMKYEFQIHITLSCLGHLKEQRQQIIQRKSL